MEVTIVRVLYECCTSACLPLKIISKIQPISTHVETVRKHDCMGGGELLGYEKDFTSCGMYFWCTRVPIQAEVQYRSANGKQICSVAYVHKYKSAAIM